MRGAAKRRERVCFDAWLPRRARVACTLALRARHAIVRTYYTHIRVRKIRGPPASILRTKDRVPIAPCPRSSQSWFRGRYGAAIEKQGFVDPALSSSNAQWSFGLMNIFPLNSAKFSKNFALQHVSIQQLGKKSCWTEQNRVKIDIERVNCMLMQQ